MKLRFKIFQHRSWLIISSLALAMGLSWSQPIRAEGSRELTANGGFRPFMDFIRAEGAPGIRRRTTIQVFARAGETINLGSSANGIGAGAINVFQPNGTQIANPCGAGEGQITTRAQELAGPAPNAGGYDPCVVDVDQEGIWTVEFTGTATLANSLVRNQINTLTDANTLVPQTAAGPRGEGEAYVSAWDVTVRGAGGNDIPGRAYATYLPLNPGGNLTLSEVVRSQLYVQTNRGDLFRVNLNGIDPFGFILFANAEGFTDGAGEPIYGSVFQDPDPNFHRPNELDNIAAGDITHKLFFNPPDQTMLEDAQVTLFDLTGFDPEILATTTTFLYRPRPPLPQISNFSFVGAENTAGVADPSQGGTFTFDTDQVGDYRIVIDVNRNGEAGDGNDRILAGRTVVGTNTIVWDGRDGNGDPLPAGNTPYETSASFFIGNVHFPFFDAENNQAGIIIERLNPATLAVENRRVYYNDAAVNDGDGSLAPTSALDGVDSAGGAHRFRQLFGDEKGIDTWVSLADPDILAGGITISKAELTIDKEVVADVIAAGSLITYVLTVRSLPDNEADPALVPPDQFTRVEGVQVTDTVPDAIGNVTWSCAITSGTGTCVTPSGTGNNVNATLNLNPGAEATITVIGSISPLAAGSLTNNATVTGPPDSLEPNPQQDPNDPLGNAALQTITIPPGPIQPAGIKTSRLVNDADGDDQPTPGDTLQYTVIYSNNDPAQDVTEFLASDTIDTSLVTFVPGSYTFEATGGAVVTENPTFDGSTDINLTSPTALGTLPSGGSLITMTYQVTINDVPLGSEIKNQAVATSRGGTLESVVTDAFAFSGDIPQVTDDGVDTGNLPNPADDEPTVVIVGGVPVAGPTRLILVKRITNALRNGVPIAGVNFNTFVDDPNDADDNLPGWSQLSTGSPVGVFQLDQPLQSGDEVEYTIYFLAEGGTTLENVQLCDPIPSGTVFVPNGFAGNSGIVLNQNGISANQTNAADGDQGQFFSPLAPVTSPPCPNPSEPQGAILVNVGNVVPTAPSNVGFVRFRIRIQ